MSPPAFITSPLFSPFAKLRLIREPFIKKWDNRSEESLSHFVLRRLGKEFLDYAINPFVAGVYAGDPDRLSVKHGFPKLYALEQKYGSLIGGQIKGARERKKSGETSKHVARMFSFKNGLKTLPEKLGKELGSSIHCSMTVCDISQKNGSFKVTAKREGNEKKEFSGDTVLYAGTAYELKDITLNENTNVFFTLLHEIYCPPVTVLGLGFKQKNVRHQLDGFGALIPKKEGYNILGSLFSSTLFQNRAPEEYVLLTVFVGGSRQPENALLPDKKLLETAINDLKRLLGIQSDPEFVFTKKWKKAIPQYEVGYGKYKDAIDSLENDVKGLYLTGNYRGGISVADTIVNADAAAQRIITQ